MAFHNFDWKFGHVVCIFKIYCRTSTAEQKEKGLNICTDLSLHAEADENFMEVIITGYETWIHVYDAETKQQSL